MYLNYVFKLNQAPLNMKTRILLNEHKLFTNMEITKLFIYLFIYYLYKNYLLIWKLPNYLYIYLFSIYTTFI